MDKLFELIKEELDYREIDCETNQPLDDIDGLVQLIADAIEDHLDD